MTVASASRHVGGASFFHTCYDEIADTRILVGWNTMTIKAILPQIQTGQYDTVLLS